MSRRAPPPSEAAPISSDVVDIVKKKIAAPRDAPPAAMTNFKPRSFPQQRLDDDRSDDKRSMRYYDADELDNSFETDGSPIRGNERSKAREIDDRDDYIDVENREYDRDRQRDIDYGRGRPQQADVGAADAKFSAQTHSDEGKILSPGVIDMTQAKATRLRTFNYQSVLNSTYRDLREFALSPVEPGVIVKCYIERNRSGSNMMYPKFTLCADLEDGTGRELLVCKKIVQSMSSHYVFSLKSEDLYRPREQRSRLYLGKLRQSGAQEYVLYDDGMVKAGDKDYGDDAGGASASDNESSRQFGGSQRTLSSAADGNTNTSEEHNTYSASTSS